MIPVYPKVIQTTLWGHFSLIFLNQRGKKKEKVNQKWGEGGEDLLFFQLISLWEEHREILPFFPFSARQRLKVGSPFVPKNCIKFFGKSQELSFYH
jgi:hypothetical protein